MCIVRVQSAFGIPVVYNDKRQPLTSFMRSLVSGGTPEKIVEVLNLKKAKPSVVEEHRLSPQCSAHQIAHHSDRYDQLSRGLNHVTTRHIGVGKRVPTEVWYYKQKRNDVLVVSVQEHMGMRCPEVVTKRYSHHSDGKHGGKALYKDKGLRRKGSVLTRAVTA